ncbi:MAG: HD domain-containing protein, partial [Planctomycetes bacterium]|nr:HD domain-containing protein [Planctomycetota bacterium]
PHVSGLDLLAYVKQHAPACKVILVTGVSRCEYLAQAIMLGAYDYLEKPFKHGELAELVSKAASGDAGSPQLPHRAAAAMELSEQVKQAALDSVRALVRAVEAKDPYTRRHSEQVTHYAVGLARALNVPEDMVEHIRVASLLHDIGKIGVPDHVLVKPGKLSDEEFEHIRRHPKLGAEILANITLFGKEAQLVRYHHERWDGEGYPDGLAGDEIPFASRIICVADCIDAMLMERTYKTGYPVGKMLGELERCVGTQFDPKIAASAVEWCGANLDELFLPSKTPALASASIQED